MSKTSLTWNQRLSLIDHFKPDDKVACAALGVSQSELTTARAIQQTAGTFAPAKDMDFGAYEGLFKNAEAPVASVSKSPGKTKPTSITKPTTAAPLSATKSTSIPKKRGRKGNNIAKAFESIPATATAAEDFASEHGVSVAVLRQSKRFDKSPEMGTVHVKKDKETKTLMIWREPVSE
jgi:hypothetical protein